jgi:hypothetical protein
MFEVFTLPINPQNQISILERKAVRKMDMLKTVGNAKELCFIVEL